MQARHGLALIVLVTTVCTLGAAGSGGAAGGPIERVTGFGPQAATQTKNGALESRLAAVAQTDRARGTAGALAQARSTGLTVEAGLVRVVIESRDPTATQSTVTSVGGRPEAVAGPLVQALVPPGSLEELARGAATRHVRPPLLAVPDAVVDEGLSSTNASAWHSLGRSGAGVKVGIVDLGFGGYEEAVANGDLPASVAAVDYCGGELSSGTMHGTEVAAIVHATAPGAELSLICIDSEVTLAQAEVYAAANGIAIVNHSVSWFDVGRGDGNAGAGMPDAVVHQARADGILWVNSAGNYAQRHWSGTYADRTGNGFMEFASQDEGESFFLADGASMCAALKWDSWPATSQDYDLYVAQSDTGDVRAQSTTLQAGEQPPFEEVCYTNTTGSDRWFFVAISRFAAKSTPRLDLFVTGAAAGLQYQVPAGSVTEPGSSPDALAVGAVCWQSSLIEPYSSRGPTIDSRLKPDIAAPDSVSTPFAGAFSACASSGFLGTSPAAAHVSGAAALVLEQHPGWVPDQVRSFLIGSAVDAGAKGSDTSYGAGRLWLPSGTPVVSKFLPTSGTVGTTVDISGTGLAGASSVRFNDTQATLVNRSPTSLRVLVPAGAESGLIRVVTPDGTATSSTPFKVLPKITGFEPAIVRRGDVVRILGFNLSTATAVMFGKTSAAFVADSGTQISATVPLTAVSGLVNVTTPDGRAASPAALVVALTPTLTSFAPTSGPVGTAVTVRGTNLDGVTSATLADDAVGSLTHLGTTQVRFTVPAGAVTGRIRVTGPGGAATSSADFRVVAGPAKAAPVIAGFEPASGLRGASIRITGSRLAGATAVKFGKAAAVDFSVDSDTRITATVPAAAVSGAITVTTPAGSATSASSFTVILPPTVKGFSPATGSAGTVVTVTGTGLDSVTRVTLGGEELGAFTHAGRTALTFAVPPGSAGGKIGVTNPAGHAESSAKFAIRFGLVSFVPASAEPGTEITLTGVGFGGVVAVKFGDLPARFTVVSDTRITATVPDGAVTAPLVVSNGTESVTGATDFRVAPTIDTFWPSGAPLTTVEITGRLFTGTTSVTFGSTPAASITVESDSLVHVVVPLRARSGRIVLTTPDGSTTTRTDFAVEPKITGFTPDGGQAGTPVTIAGVGFLEATTVFVGDTAASFTIDADGTEISTTVAEGAGEGAVTVMTPVAYDTTRRVVGACLGTEEGCFHIPGLSHASPGGAEPGVIVTFYGSSLIGVTSVTFGGTLSPYFSGAESGSGIWAAVPEMPPGPVIVTADTKWGEVSAPFTVLPRTSARLQLNEVNANLGGHSLVELRVVEGGTIDWRGRAAGYVVEPRVVVAGDLIVLHINGGYERTEMTGKDQCTDPDCYPGAWDFFPGDMFHTGIPYANQVMTVDYGSGLPVDAVVVALPGTSPSADFLDLLHDVQRYGQWQPATCGGDLCTADTTPTATAIAVDWTGLGDTPTGPSLQRIGATDTDSSADWAVRPQTFGLPNTGD